MTNRPPAEVIRCITGLRVNPRPVTIPFRKWTGTQKEMVDLVVIVHRKVFNADCLVRLVDEDNLLVSYSQLPDGKGTFDFFVRGEGFLWFEEASLSDVIDLVTDEFACHIAGDRISKSFYTTCATVSDQMVSVATQTRSFDDN